MKEGNSKNRKFYLIGGLGFSIVFILNLISKFALNQDAAIYFSDQWMSSWFPVYMVWIVFIVIGIGTSFNKN